MPGKILVPFLGGLALALASGWPLIRLLGRLRARQFVSADAPERHQAKSGTPTMGGLIILGSGIVACLAAVATMDPAALATLSRSAMPLLGLVALTLGCATIGFVDDFLIVRRGRNLGLKARHKLAFQFLLAIAFVAWYHLTLRPDPGPPGADRSLLMLWQAFQVLLIVGMSNAVNLTDGLDGLAAGVGLPVWLALAILATYGTGGNHGIAGFAAGMAGATLGYLWYNAHPAQVFMGDTGSLPLGAAMAGVAILIGQEWALLLAAGVHVIEAGSVTAQVISFQTTGRRIFRMSPLHHHFELAGWPETRVVARFAVASALLSAFALWAVLRNL
jgi:phospho-N-acetylmuramoyl-pentapeptide-transferase